jgi:GAF domain-containing protein/HAMP domain-containing protein
LFTELAPKTRRTFLTLGFITLGFVIFSLTTIRDLLAPKGINEFIVNPIPIAISILGCIATILAWKGKTRLASYLLIAAAFIGFLLISLFTTQPAYSTVAGLMIVIIPVMIATQSLSGREFIWIIILTLLARSAIQILGTYKLSAPISGGSAQTELFAERVSAIIAILFGGYVALNLNNYPFRVKMILVLSILTIIPTTILANITSHDLESNLTSEADRSLILSSEQLASAVDLYIQTTLDTTRTEAQIPSLAAFVGQPRPSAAFGGQLFPRGTDLERAASETLLSFCRRDPINIVSCKLMDNTGTVQLSTQQSEVGEFVLTQDFYYSPSSNGLPYVSPILISDIGVGIIHFSAPVRSSAGYTIGVLDITYSASVLQQTIVRNSDKLGLNISAMLLDENNIVLAYTTAPDLVYKIINPPDANTIPALIYENRLQNLPPEQLTVQMDGLTAGLKNVSEIQYFSGDFDHQQSQNPSENPTPDQAGASKLQSRNWYVVTFVPQSTLLAPVQKQARSVMFISILISMVSIAIALGVTQVLVSPILSLRRTSEQITRGDINAIATVKTQDEIGALAIAFNSMTERIRDLIGGLEQRVAERTQALERRAVQLQAAVDVGSSIARLRDLNELLQQVSHLISQRFGFYHIGVFLLDERGEYAVLRASNSDGGQRMLARGHKLEVGEVGIVGHATGTGQPRIALKVGEDAEFFNNPDLPQTQSEMAFPLIAGGKIFGALDIQSTQESAFTDEDVMTLKVLADQIAIAIENARLFSENQAALEAARRAYSEISREGWQHTLQDREAKNGYVSPTKDQILPISGEASPEFLQSIQSGQAVLTNDDTTLHLPVKIRGQSIGAIRMDKHRHGNHWTPEDITMANTLAEQLGAALESARLYNDVSQRANRERIVSEITTRIRSTTDPQVMLQTALDELKRALGADDILVRPYSPSPTGQKAGQKSRPQKSKPS